MLISILNSLLATIEFYRPDLSLHVISHIGNMSRMIPLNPPHKYFTGFSSPSSRSSEVTHLPLSTEGVPDIGELMLTSFPHSNFFQYDFIANSWYCFNLVLPRYFLSFFLLRWIGEKYDGIRICWNSGKKELYHIFEGSLHYFFDLFI